MGQLAPVIALGSQVAAIVGAVRTVQSVIKGPPKIKLPQASDLVGVGVDQEKEPDVTPVVTRAEDQYKAGLQGYFRSLAATSPTRAKRLEESGTLKARYDNQQSRSN
jgi:hypothetical protein